MNTAYQFLPDLDKYYKQFMIISLSEGDIMARTHEQFVNELKLINPSIKVIGVYTKAVEPIEVECLNCHRIWSTKAYNLLQGKGCAHCSALRGAQNNTGKTKRKTQDEFVKHNSRGQFYCLYNNLLDFRRIQL